MTNLDHAAATEYANTENWPLGNVHNLAACYLDLKSQLEAERRGHKNTKETYEEMLAGEVKAREEAYPFDVEKEVARYRQALHNATERAEKAESSLAELRRLAENLTSLNENDAAEYDKYCKAYGEICAFLKRTK